MEVLLIFGTIVSWELFRRYIAPAFYPPWRWWRGGRR